VSQRVRRIFVGRERGEEIEAQFQMRTAEQAAELLGNMKGAMMKAGQLISFLDEGLPEPVRQAFAELRQDAPPMAPELAAEVVAGELGAAPEKVFAAWEPVPIAAASIGQVHRARTHEGQDVAVKVQYPGVDEAIGADLKNAGLFFGLLGRTFQGLDTTAVVEEIRDRILEELDYTKEAANQRLFADFYRRHPFIHVPEVVDAYSTRRVLTTELAEGARYEALDDWSQQERNLAAEAIFRFVFRSIYRLHAFNGDPHPGNYLFRPGGRVTFLDFGLVKRFTPDEISIFATMAKTMAVDHDTAAFRRVIEEVGFVPSGLPFSDDDMADYFGHFYEQVLEPGPATYTSEYASETVRRLFDVNGPYAEILKAGDTPAFSVIIQRINLGLLAILGRLHATADWRRIADELWPFVDGPPATDLGREEAAWRSATGR
jgi:predicted unusual protein kinase regulating ubiquinone biosynthesis (AarF/ABC1/UbiB family)